MKLRLLKNIIIKITRLKAECSIWMSIKQVCGRTWPPPYGYACPSVLNYVVRAVFLDCDISTVIYFKPAKNVQRTRPLWQTMNTTGNDLGNVCCIFFTSALSRVKNLRRILWKGIHFCDVVTCWNWRYTKH